MSNGGTGSAKRGAFMQHAKATKELMEKFGFDSVEDLEAALGAALPDQSSVAVADAPRIDVPSSEYDPSLDPIAWTRGLETVWLVGEISHLTGNVVPAPSRAPVGEVVEGIKRHTVKTWGNCPFKFIGRTSEETNNLKIEKDNHQFFQVDRHYADRVALSQYGYIAPLVCVTPEDFQGRDWRGHPTGNKRPRSGDNLTELLRFYLQRYAGKLWIDYAYHGEHIDFNIPNPYGKGWDRWSGPDPSTVLRATASGDLQKNWESA